MKQTTNEQQPDFEWHSSTLWVCETYNIDMHVPQWWKLNASIKLSVIVVVDSFADARRVAMGSNFPLHLQTMKSAWRFDRIVLRLRQRLLGIVVVVCRHTTISSNTRSNYKNRHAQCDPCKWAILIIRWDMNQWFSSSIFSQFNNPIVNKTKRSH